MEKKKGMWGGSRGGGRPRKNRVNQNLGLDQDVVQILNKQSNKSDYVNAAIRYYEEFISTRIEEMDSLEISK